jgi:hypothetical protein
MRPPFQFHAFFACARGPPRLPRHLVHWDHAVVVCQTVRIFVAFKRQESASKAKADLDGRFFGGRTVTATFYDEESFAAGKLAP